MYAEVFPLAYMALCWNVRGPGDGRMLMILMYTAVFWSWVDTIYRGKGYEETPGRQDKLKHKLHYNLETEN